MGNERFRDNVTTLAGVALWLLTLAPLQAQQATSAVERRQVRVLSYNIHHGRGVDGRIDLKRIASVIRESGADLVALQEVDRNTGRSGGVDQLQVLAKQLGLHSAYGKAMDFDAGEYGVAWLSRWPITVAKTLRLPNQDQHEPRVALEIMIDAPHLPRTVFISTHFDHQSASLRLRQAGKVRETFGNGPSQAIVVGDLNAAPDSPALQPLWDVWQCSDHQQRATAPASQPRKKIDYVLLQSQGPWTVLSARVVEEPVASDHRPLLAVLTAAPMESDRRD